MKRARILGQAAQPTSAVKHLSDAEFSQVLAAPKAVAMFYSPNCPYSRKFMPIYETVAAQMPDVLFAAIDVDQNTQNAAKYAGTQFMLPTVVFFQNGQPVGKVSGVQEQGDFLAEMNKAFGGGTQAAPPAAPQSRQGTEAVKVEQAAAAAPASVGTYVVGGIAGLGLLGALGYLIFGGK